MNPSKVSVAFVVGLGVFALGVSRAGAAISSNYSVQTGASLSETGPAVGRFYNFRGGLPMFDPEFSLSSMPTVGDSSLVNVRGDYVASGGGITNASGTADTTGGLTSAYDSLAGTDISHNGVSAYAAANLANGTLHVAGGGSYDHPSGSNEDVFSAGIAAAAVNDTLTFNVSNATSATQTTFTIEYKLDGALATSHTGGYADGDIYYEFDLGSTRIADTGKWSPSNAPFWYSPTIFDGGGTPLQLISEQFLSDAVNNVDILATYQLTGQTGDVGVRGLLAVNGQDGVDMNYSNTASISLNLPSNMSYTSSSGVFLTQPVPEPASLAMLGGLLPILIRRRRCG